MRRGVVQGEQACPTQVFRTIKVEYEEMQRIRAEESLEVFQPELGTKPRIYYKNLAYAFCPSVLLPNLTGQSIGTRAW